VTRLLLPTLLFLATPVFAQQPVPGADAPLAIMAGEGVVRAVPDRGWITVGAESRASSARDAQRRNTELMNPILAKLKAAGVPEGAIRTIGYDVQYEWDYVNNRRVGRGYVARNTVEIRVDDIDRIGELLEIAGGSGATTLGGVRFDFKDRAALEHEALRLGVLDGRARAEAAAAAAGRAIDRIVRIEEQGVVSTPPRPMFRAGVEAAAADAAPPISAGEMEIRVRVTVTATIK
jgi:uncharacterized protein YggE